MNFSTFLAAAALATFPCEGTVAETLLCADGEVAIESADRALSLRVCSVVERARPLLNACHLYQSSPIVLQVGDHGTSLIHGCMGTYDPKTETIRVSDPGTLTDIVSAETFMGRMSAEKLFESLVVHELSHGFLKQTAEQRALCLVDHEYTAYAIQLSWLDAQEPGAVDRLLGDIKDKDVSYLNDFIALAAPDLFAKAVWAHFSASENGCAFIGQLVSGHASLYRESN
ncbi:DUF6639 family protein [Antarctobacter heliothermus]|uniref:Uncharacterized protein n=1 Tax=Antarctobacter heliothermus TaxID=74033 RepID=A0A239LPK7_9RHOB|nr:DUF6639 family protein [Antarctobacter heliothermus]SNT32381.1 hypothetical protein SAMN04488078_10972 [Antarctobacter heliothermus]